MKEKVYSDKHLLLELCLLVLGTSYLSATERTDQPSCPRGNYTLKATNITCKNDNRYPYCTWLLGTQHGNSSAIDTSCNCISSDESVDMLFALHDPLRQNGYQSWEPCPLQDQTRCFFFPTRVTDSLYVMVTINNNRLKSCTGITIEQVQVMNLATYTADELQEIEHFTAWYKPMFSSLDALIITACILCGVIVLGIAWKIKKRRKMEHDTKMDVHVPEMLSLTLTRKQMLRMLETADVDADPLLKFIKNDMEGKYIRNLSTVSMEPDIIEQPKTEELLAQRERTAYTENTSIAKTNWTRCIEMKSVVSAAKLLYANVLPTNEELQFISRTFGRRSDTVRDTCTKICQTIEESIGSDIKVWPACTVSSDKIVFVVESMLPLVNTPIIDYEIHTVNCHNTLEKEGEKVMLKEMEILASYEKYDVEKIKQLKQSISKNAKRLMDQHSNINVISPTVVKSVGYNASGQHSLIETLCISVYVEKKVRNLTPLEDEPIPADIGGFPTDILEGKFSFFGKGPKDFHRIMKMGCAIHAKVLNEKGDIYGGTLGGFVQHRTHGVCCITCAHLILSKEELQKAKHDGYLEYAEHAGKKVYQPLNETSTEFGRVVSVAFKEGSDDSPGVEVALIKVLYRHPTSGSFPQVDEGSDQKMAFGFHSGNVNDAKLLLPSTEVYKFGMSTGPTFGRLGLSGAAVRGDSNNLNDENFGICLYNQLKVYPNMNKNPSFAAPGDSGALVLIGHSRPNTAAAIGVVEGGWQYGPVYVTPLFDALEALKCPPSLKRFEDSSDSGIQVDKPQGAEATNDYEDMDCS